MPESENPYDDESENLYDNKCEQEKERDKFTFWIGWYSFLPIAVSIFVFCGYLIAAIVLFAIQNTHWGIWMSVIGIVSTALTYGLSLLFAKPILLLLKSVQQLMKK